MFKKFIKEGLVALMVTLSFFASLALTTNAHATPSCTQTIFTYTMSGVHTWSNASSTQYFEAVKIEDIPNLTSCKAVGDAEKLIALKNGKGSVMAHDFDYQCTRVEAFAFAKLNIDCIFP